MKKGNEKFVGAAISRPHLEEMTPNDKGITLIALIITIIVMLILVGVTVNVALNGGLFDAAKQAASGMNIAQIREKAEMTKVVLIADEQTDAGVTANISTYRERLLEEFNSTDTDGNNIIEVNDKYVIIIKNSDLDIEVFEKTKIPANYLLISLGYETSNIEEIYGTDVSLNITRLISDYDEYIALRKEQDKSNGVVVSFETKEEVFLEVFSQIFLPDEPFASIDEIVLYDINNNWGYGPFETLDDALEDETVQADYGIKKEQVYYTSMYNNYLVPDDIENSEMTEEKAINFVYEQEKYGEEYLKYANDLLLYVAIDGKEQEMPIERVVFGIDTNQKTVNYTIGENGTYEFILKTKNGEEIAREVLRVNNILK